jgi:hypothetical protein
VALYDEETARGRISIHLTSDSEGVCDGDVGESAFTEDDTCCAERVGGGGVNNIIQYKLDRTIKKREN